MIITWDIYHKISPHWRRLEHIYFHLRTDFFYPLCQITTFRPTASSITYCLIDILVSIASLPIMFVVVLFYWVSLMNFQYQPSIVFYHLLERMICCVLWIRMFLLTANLSIKLLPVMIVLESIGTLQQKSTSVMVCWCQRGIKPLGQYHIYPQNKNILLES